MSKKTCVTGKWRYSSRAIADRMLLRIWQNSLKDRRGLHRELRSYYCELCVGWHLTKKERLGE